MSEKIELKPFTKWVGGKRQLLNELLDNIPEEFNTYYEPMVGGGALFFALKAEIAVINDSNTDLMLAYQSIKDNVDELIEVLKIHDENNSKEYYLDLRKSDRDGRYEKMSDAEKAARLIYMLRVNFNGLYRVNQKGQFNVPYGRYKNPNIVDEDSLLAISKYFNTNQIKIMNGSYEEAVKDAKAGDFIYFDPPYIPVNETSSFTSYTANGFNYQEQIKLRDTFKELDERGCYLMLSNSAAEEVFDLYRDYAETTIIVQASRMINSNASKRGHVDEVLIKNY